MTCQGVTGALLRVIVLSLILVGTLAAHFYTDNGLAQTVIVDRMPKAQRRELKHEVLQLLGLHHRPRPSHHPRDNSAPNFMMSLYRLIEEHEERGSGGHWSRGSLRSLDDAVTNLTLRGNEVSIDKADLIMSFINQAQAHADFDTNRRFFFDFSGVPNTESIIEAELRLYKHPAMSMRDRGPFSLHLYRIMQGNDWEEMYMELESNMTVQAWDSGWILVNSTLAVQQWAYFSSSNYGLYLTITDSYGYELTASDIGISDDSAPDHEHAFLVAFFKGPQRLASRVLKSRRYSSSGRSRRELDPSYSSISYTYSKKNCQKHNLFVSFRELGWQDWIIAPESYKAFYCHGECSFPLNAHMNATNHAIVQTLVHLMNSMTAPKPCCVPAKLSAISVLYFDDNSNVILKKFKNMVVRACGCH